MYSRLTIEEREGIAKDLAQHQPVKDIALKLKRARSTIYQEINLPNQNPYSPVYSHEAALRRQRGKRVGRKKIVGLLQEFIDEHLKKRWSPETISNQLKIKHPKSSMQISYEAIYQYIYSQERERRKELISYLRHTEKSRDVEEK